MWTVEYFPSPRMGGTIPWRVVWNHKVQYFLVNRWNSYDGVNIMEPWWNRCNICSVGFFVENSEKGLILKKKFFCSKNEVKKFILNKWNNISEKSYTASLLFHLFASKYFTFLFRIILASAIRPQRKNIFQSTFFI